MKDALVPATTVASTFVVFCWEGGESDGERVRLDQEGGKEESERGRKDRE